MLLSLRLPATGGPRLSESAVKALHEPAHIFQLLVHGHFAVIVETELLFALHGPPSRKGLIREREGVFLRLSQPSGLWKAR